VESPPGAPGFSTMTDNTASKPAWPPVRVAQWATIAILVVISEVVSWSGHAGASYGVDGLAVLAFLGFRWLRRSGPAKLQG
jgi:hypothetical protein